MEWEKIERVYNIGDCVVTEGSKVVYIGLVVDFWYSEQVYDDHPWIYKVLWNDGDTTEEDTLEHLIDAGYYFKEHKP